MPAARRAFIIAQGRPQKDFLRDWQPEEFNAQISPTVNRKKGKYEGRLWEKKRQELTLIRQEQDYPFTGGKTLNIKAPKRPFLLFYVPYPNYFMDSENPNYPFIYSDLSNSAGQALLSLFHSVHESQVTHP